MSLIDDGSTKALVGKLGVFVGQDYVGKLEFTINKKIPAGKIPAFGTTYSRTTYDKLWQYIQEHPDMMLSEADWQAYSSSHNGQVPFYSDGDGSTTFRTPCLKGIVEGGASINEVATNKEAGLPNITGYIQAGAGETGQTAGGYGVFRYVGGAFYGDQEVQFSPTGYQGSYPSGPTYQYTRMDASRSNPIYGNSSTVQPPTIVGMWLITAYVAVTNITSTTLDNIASGLTELETRAVQSVNNITCDLSGNVNLNYKFFNDITQLGLDRATVTWELIYNALPLNSVLIFACDGNSVGGGYTPMLELPSANAYIVTATKTKNLTWPMTIQAYRNAYTLSDYRLIYAFFHITGKFSGWKHTPATVNNILPDNTGNIDIRHTFYRSLDDLNLTPNTVTFKQIYDSMPLNSSLWFACNSSSASDAYTPNLNLPVLAGSIYVEKGRSSNHAVVFTYIVNNSNINTPYMYTCIYHPSSASVTPWQEMLGIIEQVQDASTGYIKYSDGRMEQWGVFNTGDLSINTGTTITINFPQPFINTNYRETLTLYGGGNGYAELGYGFIFSSKKTTSIQSCIFASNSAASGVKFSWEVTGWWK